MITLKHSPGVISHPEPDSLIQRPYFAYGSNLHLDQMFRRCPSAQALGRAVAEGQQLAFTGYSAGWGGAVATLLPTSGGRVQGVLFELTQRDRESLDAAEGHPNWYVRVPIRVRSRKGRFVGAETYLLMGESEAAPSERYILQIWNAYIRWGFDLAPLRNAIHSSRKLTSLQGSRIQWGT